MTPPTGLDVQSVLALRGGTEQYKLRSPDGLEFAITIPSASDSPLSIQFWGRGSPPAISWINSRPSVRVLLPTAPPTKRLPCGNWRIADSAVDAPRLVPCLPQLLRQDCRPQILNQEPLG